MPLSEPTINSSGVDPSHAADGDPQDCRRTVSAESSWPGSLAVTLRAACATAILPARSLDQPRPRDKAAKRLFPAINRYLAAHKVGPNSFVWTTMPQRITAKLQHLNASVH